MSQRADPTTGAAPGADWPAEYTGKVVSLVDSVRAKTTGPAISAARAAVYGLLAALLGTAALVLAAIGAVRVIDVYLPESVFGTDHTWAAHLIVGVAFCALGLYLWTKRRPRAEPATTR